MGRPHRVSIPGIAYHITARGDNREVIFRDDTDCQRYLQLLKACKTKWEFDLFCYALMPNHVHLLLRPTVSHGTTSRILHNLQFRYAKYFNARHQRVGHVFQERFHTSTIEKDSYLLVASRYIHLNPVRASLCRTAREYPWTSFRAYVDSSGDPLNLIDTKLILSMCSPDPLLQSSAYYRLVEAEWCLAPKA